MVSFFDKFEQHLESCALYTQNPLKRALNKVNRLNNSKNISRHKQPQKSRKQNKYISKQKQNYKLKKRRPNNCISEKYLENDKYREKRKKITS